MNKKLIIWSIAVGLGGFLFGMDVAVISGAEQKIQQLWKLSDLSHGLAIAIAYADLFLITTTIMNQSGQSITGMVMVMVTYLIMSLIIAAGSNWVNRRFQTVPRFVGRLFRWSWRCSPRTCLPSSILARRSPSPMLS